MKAPAKAFSSEVDTGSREKTRQASARQTPGAQWSTSDLNGQ